MFRRLSPTTSTTKVSLAAFAMTSTITPTASTQRRFQASSQTAAPKEIKLKIKAASRSLLDPLLAAVRDGQVNRVRHLLEVGSSAGCPYHSPAYIEDPLGNTALHYAAHHGMDEVAFMMVAAGAEVGHKNDFGHTAEKVAQDKGNSRLRAFLSGANTLQLGMERACEFGDTKFVDYLMEEAGAAPTKAAALAAVKNGHDDLAGKLTRHIHGFDQKMLPLHEAAQQGDVATVKGLLKSKNKDVDQVRNKDNRTALHFAAEHGHPSIVDALVAAGAQVSPAACMDGLTPLHWAAKNGHIACVKRLLSLGASKDQVGLDGITPLHMAAHNGHQEVVELLLAVGASAAAKLDDGSKPLDLARTAGHTGVVSSLMRLATNAHGDLWNEPCDVRVCATSDEPEHFEDAEKEKYELGKELISRMCVKNASKARNKIQQRVVAVKRRSKKIVI